MSFIAWHVAYVGTTVQHVTESSNGYRLTASDGYGEHWDTLPTRSREATTEEINSYNDRRESRGLRRL